MGRGASTRIAVLVPLVPLQGCAHLSPCWELRASLVTEAGTLWEILLPSQLLGPP